MFSGVPAFRRQNRLDQRTVLPDHANWTQYQLPNLANVRIGEFAAKVWNCADRQKFPVIVEFPRLLLLRKGLARFFLSSSALRAVFQFKYGSESRTTLPN